MTLVGGYNAGGLQVGGTRPYVENLDETLATAAVPHIVIVSGPVKAESSDWVSIPTRRPGSALHFLASLTANLPSLTLPEDTIVHVQRPDHLLPFLAAGIGDKRVITLHGDPARAIRERRSGLVAAANAVAERFVLSHVDRVVAVDSATSFAYTGRYPWLRGRLDVIPNGVDTQQFRPLDKATCKARWGFGETVLLFAGRIEPEKRVEAVIKAFLSLGVSGATLAIAGEGGDRIRLEKQYAQERIRFLGPVPRSEMPGLLNACDALVLFSAREGLPSVVLEALACGVPVICTSAGDLPRVIERDRNGWLVADEAELRKAMRVSMRGSPWSAREIVDTVSAYRWARVGPQILRLYEGLMSSAK